MTALLLVLALGQTSSCTALVAAASERAAAFDMQSAIAGLTRAPEACANAGAALWYLRGLAAAEEAYRYGGSAESLAPVRKAIDELGVRASASPSAEIARAVLLAAAAAAQSEREEMSVLIDHARDLERTKRAAGAADLPVVSAYEAAGDLWLRVHRFEDAQGAYITAAAQVGRTRRVTLGLARAAARLGDEATACAEYRELAGAWPPAAGEPPEIVEARTFLRAPSCGTPGGAPSRR